MLQNLQQIFSTPIYDNSLKKYAQECGKCFLLHHFRKFVQRILEIYTDRESRVQTIIILFHRSQITTRQIEVLRSPPQIARFSTNGSSLKKIWAHSTHISGTRFQVSKSLFLKYAKSKVILLVNRTIWSNPFLVFQEKVRIFLGHSIFITLVINYNSRF